MRPRVEIQRTAPGLYRIHVFEEQGRKPILTVRVQGEMPVPPESEKGFFALEEIGRALGVDIDPRLVQTLFLRQMLDPAEEQEGFEPAEPGAEG